ncbi:MAG: hypothetical protein B7Z55_02225 [Planctomycetales bacterium 12-60-4]|nr:MAG: hypothetical protein B7Z55_02225 [Planctomycetales bacterium 12-60-4]
MLVAGCGSPIPSAADKSAASTVEDTIADTPGVPDVWLPVTGPTERDYPELHNLLQATSRIYSGGEPRTDVAFASLEQLGVKTIVSVDGATPQAELAAMHGLRYVHIPIGYDGIHSEAGQALAQVVRTIAGPIYFHCHHGQHRGPAATAVACIADGAATSEQALALLRKAGTDEKYSGLWRDVAAYRPPAIDAELPELVSVAKVESLAAAMAKIDRASDNLKLLAASNWERPPNHPDLITVAEAVLFLEGFREAARLQSGDYDDQFQTWMQEAAATSEAFNTSLEQSSPEALGLWMKLQSQCGRCHKRYRD